MPLQFVREVRNFFYAVECFREITDNAVLRKKYAIKHEEEDGKATYTQNPKMTRLGVLYIYAVIPKEVTAEKHEAWLSAHMELLNNALMAMDLYGAVSMKSRTFDTDNGTIYLMKYVPVMKLWSFVKFALVATATAAVLLWTLSWMRSVHPEYLPSFLKR